MERKKLAIIGASVGQYALCMKAKEMGLETFCFAYEKGAICKEIVDHFFPISITEKDQIVNVCKEEGVEAIVSNASEMTAEVILHSQQDGTFQELSLSEEIKPFVYEEDLWVKPGDQVSSFIGANDAIGTLVLKADSAEKIESFVGNIACFLAVNVK